MAGGILEVLGLSPVQGSRAIPAGELLEKFRQEIGALNVDVRVAAGHAKAGDFQHLDAQRSMLFDAFHKVATAGSGGGSGSDRLFAAVSQVTGKASAVAADAVAGRDEWAKRERAFDGAEAQVNALEDAQHPKAGTLRKVLETIRARANELRYGEASASLDQLLPKLPELSDPTPTPGDQSRSKEQFLAELEALEKAIEQLMSDHAVAV
ncbi:MAG: hypothetical protein ACRCT8_01735 [Lacipirellulaceae bacterium]